MLQHPVTVDTVYTVLSTLTILFWIQKSINLRCTGSQAQQFCCTARQSHAVFSSGYQPLTDEVDIFSPASASNNIMAVDNYQSRAIPNQSNVTAFTEHQTEYDILNYYDYYDYLLSFWQAQSLIQVATICNC